MCYIMIWVVVMQVHTYVKIHWDLHCTVNMYAPFCMLYHSKHYSMHINHTAQYLAYGKYSVSDNVNTATSYSSQLILQSSKRPIALVLSSGVQCIPWECEFSELLNVTERRGNMEEAIWSFCLLRSGFDKVSRQICLTPKWTISSTGPRKSKYKIEFCFNNPRSGTEVIKWPQ